MASTIGELLVWVPTPAARASTAVPIHRSSISSGSNTNFHRASVSSLADLLSAADEEDIDDLELISGAKEHKLIARMEKAQRRLRASKSQMELNKRKQQHDELAMLWRLEGELQAAAGGPLGAPERRVRKDFRKTNDTTDIPGAQPAKMCGHTSSGYLRINPEAVRDWSGHNAMVKDDEQLFEAPDSRLPPKRVPAHVAQILLETAGVARTGPELKTNGRCTFEERVYRSASVECHISTPGVGLRAARRPLAPLVEPPVYSRDDRLLTIPASSIHYHPELKTFNPSHTSLNAHRNSHPRNLLDCAAKRRQQKACVDFSVPDHDGPADKSLNTADIHGARGRKLVSATNRRPLGYAESPWR